MMIKPKILHPGSLIAAISLSWGGPGTIPHRYQIGKQQFEEEFGVTVIETGMDFGHTDPMFVIPIGTNVRIDSTKQEIAIDEAAVINN